MLWLLFFSTPKELLLALWLKNVSFKEKLLSHTLEDEYTPQHGKIYNLLYDRKKCMCIHIYTYEIYIFYAKQYMNIYTFEQRVKWYILGLIWLTKETRRLKNSKLLLCFYIACFIFKQLKP